MDYPISKAAELALVGGKFADYNPVGDVDGSIVPAVDWSNQVTDELIGLQTAAGLVATEGDNTQVAAAVNILARGGALGFRVKPQNPLSMSVDIEAGAFFSRETGLMVSVAATNAGPIAAPAANPRNDIVYIDALTGAVGIETGAENAAPVDPAIPPGKLPVRRIVAYVGMAQITLADIEELRYLSQMGATPSGKMLQVANTQTGALSTGTTIIPNDNTIPQQTEGDEVMSLAFIPKSAASFLLIEVVSVQGASLSNLNTAALFRDAGADAIAAQGVFQAQGVTSNLTLNHVMPSPGLGATTFKVRVGAGSGTTTFNGLATVAKLGGALRSSITVTEFLP